MKQFLSCSKGVVSIEFVLVLPLFILFTFGIIGFSAVSYVHNNMVNASREATRQLSVADGVTCSDNLCAGIPVVCDTFAVLPGTAEAIACEYLANWGLTWTVTATEIVTDACDSTMQVAISTSAEDAFMIDFMGFFDSDSLLTATVKMRKELRKRCTL